SGRKREAARTAFQIGNTLFVRKPGRVDRARVIVAFMLPRTFLHIRRGRVNRRHDGASCRIRFLAGVDRAGSKLVLFLHVDLKFKPNRGMERMGGTTCTLMPRG